MHLRWRLGAAVVGSGIIASGLVFAVRSPGPAVSGREVRVRLPADGPVASTIVGSSGSGGYGTTVVATVIAAAGGETQTPDSPGTATPSPAAAASPAVPPTSGSTVTRPAATPPATAGALPASVETPRASKTAAVAAPRYSDLQVIQLSREVRLPSGRTFSECALQGGESWPGAVHDYWVAGTNDWVIETHNSDVGLLFSELTGAFTVRNVSRSTC